MPAREPLTDVERQAWQGLISVTTRIPAAVDARLARDAAMTHFQYQLLAVLSEQPNYELQQLELARAMGASLSRLSHVVSGLVQLGWVRRAPIRVRRGHNAILTAGGLEAFEKATPVFLDAVRGLVFDGLDEAGVCQLLAVAQALLGVTNGKD